MAKYCKTCGRDQEEHPEIIPGKRFTRYCDLVLVKDVRHDDGSVEIVEADDESDSPYERTRSNNIRYVHSSALVAR